MTGRRVPRRSPRAAVLLLAVSALTLALLALSACASGPMFSGAALSPPVLPGKTDFSTPKTAVLTYLDYTSFAYRMVNSDLASAVASPYEGVRVDSYIELNREKDRGIEQQLMTFTQRSESKVATTVLLAVREDWKYRYFSLTTKRYTTPMYDASYDTTYTLVKRPQGGWYVDKVDAKPLTAVQ
jgi:hypothetical protein